MKYLTRMSIALCLFGFGTAMQAQNAIPASGGNASGSGGTVSYTVGQTIYTANSGMNGTVSQGVQQPYEILTVFVSEETKDISLECSAFPNPVDDYLKLKVNYTTEENLSYLLYDISGKLLLTQKVINAETLIFMNNLPAAVYFLKINDNNKEVKTFKIIKN
jgi:hypothetical protein